MSKFTFNERNKVKTIVATLTIKRIPDNEIVKEIFEQTNKTMTVRHLARIKKRLKIESYLWYTKLRQDQYAYINEFKERINEIMDLQKRCHVLIESNKHNPQIQLSAIAELHRLNITLSNYIDVLPTVINDSTFSAAPEVKSSQESERSSSNITV